MENLILRLGRPGRIRRTAKHALAWPKTRRGPGQAPASAQQLTHGSRTTERQTGKEERTAAWLVTRAHLVVPSILAIFADKGSDDGHGGARPRVGRLRRGDGVTALVAYSPSISSTHRT